MIAALCLFALPCHAQGTTDDAALLQQVRAKYDAPFSRTLQSFTCAVKFDWKTHWAETARVGDEGTDSEIEDSIQPIPNRVTVTSEDATVSSGMTEEQEHNLPRGGMAEGLLKHAIRFSLRTWLVASTNSLLPAPGTPVHFAASASGFKLTLKIQQFDVAMAITSDMGLQNMVAGNSESDRQEFKFNPGPQGFLLDTWTMGEDGNFAPGNRILFSYTYQSVDGFQIPYQMSVNRESHHEVWRYKLTDCKVVTNSSNQ